MKPTFVIGDVHGHYRELQALLDKAGVTPADDIVQLGDLGQFDAESMPGDALCYGLAHQYHMRVLWGNHDLAVKDSHHTFRGYVQPPDGTIVIMDRVNPSFAAARHGYLLTHAGLHPLFYPAGGSADAMAREINQVGEQHMRAIIDFISQYRGGFDPAGGVVWRDAREPLADIPQVFGHTRGLVRRYGEHRFCIDVAEKGASTNLVGLWLPEERLVAVGPDAEMYEQFTEGVMW